MRRRHGAHAAGRRAGARLAAAALVVLGAGFAHVAAAQGQMYKWKDAAGVVHYSDTPPTHGQARVLRADSGPAVAPSLPYELARAVRNHPVTLYTTARCDACDTGRNLLRTRGIPFAEKTVNTAQDQLELRRIGGKDELPLLVVGSRQVAGFQAAAWNEALDSASYPRKTMLPPSYRTGAAEPAAPPAALPAAPAPATPAPARDAAQPAVQRQIQQQVQQQIRQPRGQAPQPTRTPPDFQF